MMRLFSLMGLGKSFYEQKPVVKQCWCLLIHDPVTKLVAAEMEYGKGKKDRKTKSHSQGTEEVH